MWYGPVLGPVGAVSHTHESCNAFFDHVMRIVDNVTTARFDMDIDSDPNLPAKINTVRSTPDATGIDAMHPEHRAETGQHPPPAGTGTTPTHPAGTGKHPPQGGPIRVTEVEHIV